MRAGARTIGLLLTAAVVACGERPAKAGLLGVERADRTDNRDRRASPDQQWASGGSAPVRDAGSACDTATARVTAQRGLPISHVATCDHIAEADGLAGYYVLALRARCQEDLCGSTSMGWFAVQKATADVFEVRDLTNGKLGRRVTGGS